MSKQTTLIERLQEQADIQADKRAFTFLADGETEIDSLTYHQLHERAKAIAFVLQDCQAQNQRALLLYQPGLDFITAFLGCLYAGVVAVPVYPPRANRSIERLLAIVKDSGASFALTTQAIQAQIASKFDAHHNTEKIQFFATDTFELNLAQDWQYPDLTTDSLAFLQYTSGSTGTPKGVMVSHGNVMANSATIDRCFQNQRNHQAVSWLPPYHDMGLIGCIIQPIYVGLSMYLMAPVTFLQRPYRWLKAISQYKGVTNGGPNFAYDLCVDRITLEQKATLDLSCWELAFCGAEPVRAKTIDRFSEYFRECGFRKSAFYTCYGMAESTLMITGGDKYAEVVTKKFDSKKLEQNIAVSPQDEQDKVVLVGSGSNIPEQNIVIANPDTLNSCANGEIGEIWSKSKSVAQGYWNQPELTENSFDAVLADTNEGGWLRTGDLGFLDDGELFVTGRLKDLIIIHGRNYYPQDIELTVENAHAAIRLGNIAAFAVEIEGKEQLVITPEIKRTHLRKLNVDEVTKAIRKAVAQRHDLQIQAIVLIKIGGIPKTSSGKIQRHACKAGYLNGSLNAVGEYRKPAPKPVETFHETSSQTINNQSNQIQNWLIENLAQRLGVPASEIDTNEPFASSGLNSLDAVSLSADLEDWLDLKLSPTIVFDYPNIRELAVYLSNSKDNSPQELALNVASEQRRENSQQDIAVIGMGCQFPGAKSPDEFWQLLQSGKDAIKKSARWSEPFYGGFIDDVDKFDPQFFGITPREAQSIDPQQRLLLEVSWSALEDAAIANKGLLGSNTGVFVGISSSDYSQLRFHYGLDVDAYVGTGNAHSIAANRLSYLFDLKGPSIAIDTACSSSLVAIHLASQSLKTGECNLAIAGGVNLMLSPELTQTFSIAGMMAEDGRCKTFDASADGYVRGEGCGVIILKRLEDARQDGDRILAVIKGSAINQDGRSNGLTAPNGRSQQAVIERALANAQVNAREISYIEAHGTGTSLGDPIEVNSLKAVLGNEREDICYLGSLKTNIGHLESAAGIASLIKTVLCLQHRAIPPNLHFQQLNPLIDLADSSIAIPQALQPWSTSTPRYAGISSFGFGGTNAHVVVGESSATPPEIKNIDDANAGDKLPLHLLTLSGKSKAALTDLVLSYKDYLVEQSEVDLGDICYTANLGRSHFNYRLAIAADSKTQLQTKLAKFTAGQLKTIAYGEGDRQQRHQVAFLFTGQGSQYSNMGYQLYQTQPVFKQALDRCGDILDAYLDTPLLEVLYPHLAAIPDARKSASLVDETIYTQPAIFALEYALAQMWISWGIQPAALIGHSVGEYVAATVAGVFSLADGLKLLATRGQLMQSLPQNGAMHAVFSDEATVKKTIEPLVQVAIAAINGSQNIVISGEQIAVDLAISKLEAQGIKNTQLNVSHAFHSPLMNPVLERFRQVAESIDYHQPRFKLVSNVTGHIATESISTPDYWVNHVVAPVRFAEGMKTLAQEQCNIFLEIGAKPILLGMGRSCLSSSSDREFWLPSLRPRKQDGQQILRTLGDLYAAGIDINWENFYAQRSYNKIALPTYAFQKQSYWLPQKTKSPDKIKMFLPSQKQTDLPDLYDVEWQLSSGRIASDTATINDRPWLIFGDRHGVAEGLTAKLKQQQQDYVLLTAERLKTLDLKGLTQLLLEQNCQWSKIVYLTGLDSLKIATIADINAYQQQHCTNILNLVQALAANSATGQIWLSTRGSQPIENKPNSSAVASSCLWGLASAISIEHPEHWGGIVDLASKPTQPEAELLLAIVNRQNKEDRLALRGSQVYVTRLKPTIVKSTPALKIKTDAAYLITGGLGSLGLQAAQWLGNRGAKNLILVGRKEPQQNAQQAIDKLQEQGITVDVVQADITDYDTVKNIFRDRELITQTISPSPQVPIEGIIHAAGVLDDGLLQSQTWSRFERVIAPKVAGAWNLHQCTQDRELDFFVMFSSAASLIGSPGQSNYSVANTSLDAIAHYRRAQNLPALSINWGAWSKSGMAIEQGFHVDGLESIEPQQGLQALELLLTSELPQVGVLNADWQKLSRKFTYLKQSNYFSQLVSQTKSDPSQNQAVFQALLATPAPERSQYLVDYLQQAIAEILQIKPVNLSVEASLLDLGMDSLMVMEAINQLKADLQLILYPREFYERPQITDLAIYLAAEFSQTHLKAASPVIAKAKPQVLSTKLPPAAFILSSPRSGSTLLRVMLAGHPKLSSPPELHLLPFDDLQQREAELGVSQLGEGLKRALMALKGIDAAQSQTLVDELIQANYSVQQVYQMLQQLAGDKLLIDKSPTYASNRETLEKAETIFNGAKYIHLVRHPYGVVESFARMRMNKLVGSGSEDPYQLGELIWRDSNQNAIAFAQDIDPERYHLVYYEELVSQPKAVMEGICQFLRVPYDDAVLTPYKGDRMTDGVSNTAMSIGDPNFLARQQIEANLGSKWREIKLPALLSTYTQQLAKQLNYELPQEANADVVDLLMEETLITIRGLKICLCTWGPEEGPLVLCLHGILEQGAAWSEVAIRLAQKGYRVIAPDLRGHGRSDRVGKGGTYNLIDFLGDIDAIVENLAGRAFILVGHSLGSVLGAIFATIRPQRIRNIVLVETILPTANEDEDPTAALANQLDQMATPPKHPVFPNIEAAAERLRQATPAISTSLAMMLAERITEPCEGGVRWRWEPLLRTRAGINLNGIGRSRYLKLLQKIKVPITLVYGDKSNFNRIEDLNKQQEAMPNATKVVVSGGHNLPLEAPSALAKIISSAVALTNKLIP